MAYWKRHPKQGGREALEEFDRMGWTILDPPKYYQVRCPCGQHQTHVHLTPSNPNHFSQRVAWG